MGKNILKRINLGKNIKIVYYINNYFYYLFIPSFLLRWRLKYMLNQAEKDPDPAYIYARVNYYNKMDQPTTLPPDSPCLGEHKLGRQKVYFFDSYRHTSWFNPALKWQFLPGDVTIIPPYPTILKSRPIVGDNRNSVVMKLELIRHFIFVNDKKDFTQKKGTAIFRGKISNKPHRIDFMNKFHGSAFCDCGDVSRDPSIPSEWKKPEISIDEHLNYKYIMAIEGNDVASNLKWVMSSNSIAVMPRPKYETWFMEGTLIPNYHYIEIADDYSDLEEKLNYYNQHTDEALQIIKNANEYVLPFMNAKREKIISLLVLHKYFIKTEQIDTNEISSRYSII